ncbi:serine/threonine-protein phosphatase 6 regulatory ankyrin repeat subunit C-like isoform X2 [Portunus trituberculatus]|uniref:serine/threonine-protein phosphatase 6 regulatory ankyrin repeat subunit C-like isoform X2 n=1 Tax=Portunus trituberculatus TaxID=210409 RepID=UPI001E1CE6A7|nr:serine/threonine-protein phosphatase 6 regulatory ankyrin repeat subunit C-like isoform X2 [Portunus trituberculatus]
MVPGNEGRTSYTANAYKRSRVHSFRACLVCAAANEGHDHLLPHLRQAELTIEGGGTAECRPLMLAAVKSHTQTVKALVSLGANPLAIDRQGWTALHIAAGVGRQKCVAAVLSVTPATAAHLEGVTPVHAASYYGQVQVLEQLAIAGWPLTGMESSGWTPLHWSACGGHVSAVWWLALRGGDPCMQTPLDLAVMHGRPEVETWLNMNGGGGVTMGSEAPRVTCGCAPPPPPPPPPTPPAQLQLAYQSPEGSRRERAVPSLSGCGPSP